VDGRDEQDEVAIDVARWVTLAEHTLESEGIRGEAELSLLFVNEAAIADLNHRYLGEDRPTDVLAFPIDDDPEPQGPVPRLLGDVVVCPSVAARQAPDHDATLEDELALLVVHGVLHVLGHDHAYASETEAMRARERQILDTFGP
jgi:probable rRNA maturation factor